MIEEDKGIFKTNLEGWNVWLVNSAILNIYLVELSLLSLLIFLIHILLILIKVCNDDHFSSKFLCILDLGVE